jgi:hypothetical protein
VGALGLIGLIALVYLERVDLSDTGQVARSAGIRARTGAVASSAMGSFPWRPVHQVLRPLGVRRFKVPLERRWRKHPLRSRAQRDHYETELRV